MLRNNTVRLLLATIALALAFTAATNDARAANTNWTWGFTGTYIPYGSGNTRGTLTQKSTLTFTASTNTLATTNATISSALTAGTVNKVTITAPATSATLTIANGKTLTASNTLTFTGTDASSVAFGTGGTVAYTANKLSAFASTTSAELYGVISNPTGSGGSLVFATSPTLTTPTLGVASATSVNKLTITAPATSATLTVADGKTLTAVNSLALYGTDDTSFTFPLTTGTVATLDETQTFTNKTLTAPTISGGGTIDGAVIGGSTPAQVTATGLYANDDVTVSTAGKGFRVKEGSNARMGQVTLSSGIATVSNTSVTANTRVILTGVGATATDLYLPEDPTAGVGFDIYSNDGGDSTTKVNYILFEPAP